RPQTRRSSCAPRPRRRAEVCTACAASTRRGQLSGRAFADMDWLQAPDYWLARLVIERALGAIYLVAFLVGAFQFRPLLGEKGLLPVPRFLRRVRFLEAPSLFHLHYSDRLLLVIAWTGVLLAVSVVVGLPDVAPPWVAIVVWFALCALSQSIVNVGW